MGSVRLYGSTSGYLELQAPAVAPDAVLTLPSDSVQPGLVHLHTETFSAVSSVSIDNVFSAEYDHYRILAEGTGSGSIDFYARLRASGSDDTTSNYVQQQLLANGTTVAGQRATRTHFYFSGMNSGAQNAHAMDFYGPALAQNTVVTYHGLLNVSSAYLFLASAQHTSGTAFDGITFYPSSGTMTGTLRIYGYRNS